MLFLFRKFVLSFLPTLLRQVQFLKVQQLSMELNINLHIK